GEEQRVGPAQEESQRGHRGGQPPGSRHDRRRDQVRNGERGEQAALEVHTREAVPDGFTKENGKEVGKAGQADSSTGARSDYTPACAFPARPPASRLAGPLDADLRKNSDEGVTGGGEADVMRLPLQDRRDWRVRGGTRTNERRRDPRSYE
ncbi:hypothetical protein THAOC_27028, partial [Thalassiosira oceanica]